MSTIIDKDFTKDLQLIAPTLDIESIKKQNKAKVWTTRLLTLTVDKSGNFVHNADKIKEAVLKGTIVLKNNLELTDSLDDVEMFSDTLNTLHTWLQGTRKESTSNMDELKKVLSEPEKLLNDMKPLIKEKMDKLNEVIYSSRRIHIFNEFQVLEDESVLDECDINFDVFNSFADEKKKAKTYDLNKSKKLSAAAKKAIKEQFDLVANPIIESKKLAIAKEKEQKFLTKELNMIITAGNNEVLEKSIIVLGGILDNLESDYFNIKESAKSQVTNMIDIVKRSISQNDKIEKENVQDNKDLMFLCIFDDLDSDNNDISYNKSLLEKLENYEDLGNMLPRNRKVANDWISLLDTKIQTLKQNELKNVVVHSSLKQNNIDNAHVHTGIVDEEIALPESAIKDREEKHNDCLDEVVAMSKNKSFCISNEDIEDLKEFLEEITIDSDNQDEAKKEMTGKFSAYLGMLNLKEV